MRWGCCGDAASIQTIADAGYDFLECPVRALGIGQPDGAAEAFKRAVGETGLAVEVFNVFVPGTLPIVGPEADLAKLEQHVRAVVEAVAGLGTRIIVLGSGGARKIPAGWDETRARSQFLAFCDLAAACVAPAGITIVIEPLVTTSCNYILTVDEGRELAQASGRREISTLADLYHMHFNDDPVSALADAAPELQHVHLPVPNLAGLIEHDLTFDHAGFLAALKAGGYNGRISVEDNGKRFGTLAAEAGPVREFLEQAWASA